MARNILLLEPKYRNKYPPIGLMKIATYHRLLGDKVTFFKGDLRLLVLSELTSACMEELAVIRASFNWLLVRQDIQKFIKTKKIEFLKAIPLDDYEASIELIACLSRYSDIYRNKRVNLYPKWDRIYVTTLFTFYWKVTVEAIQFAKDLVVDLEELLVGGVLASLLQKELEAETGLKSMPGLLDKPGMLDPSIPAAEGLIVDNLPLDYSILDEIDYEYPTGSAYFTFMTKGCTRKCSFCSVPILEPVYKPKIETKDKFFETKETFGEQQNLLLMDNNVLASPNFPEIIQEIKDMGFHKGATYVEPNQYEIAISNLRSGFNDRAYANRCYKLLHAVRRRIRGGSKAVFEAALVQYDLLEKDRVTKDNLLRSYAELSDIYEKYRSKVPKLRFVDFNQGTDARYVTDELMKLMSEIPIKPLRIAFDYWGMKDKYEAAIRLAAKYDISELSNYILYNFKDDPAELYKRLEINVLLGEELRISIYSFPMKYIPLFGEEAKNRDYIGSKWNKKFIRAIQSILNVTKGIVAPGRAFFERAFGSNLREFEELLYMPEAYIIYRKIFESNGMTQEWRSQFSSLQDEERAVCLSIVEANVFSDLPETLSTGARNFLGHYFTIKSEDIHLYQKGDSDYRTVKSQFEKIVKEDRFKDLTLTYDFEKEVISD